jgi:MFS family permease
MELHSAIKELWKYPLIYSSDVFSCFHFVNRLTLLGVALGLIFYGSLSDRIGRYRTMLIGLTIAPFFAAVCGYFSDRLLFLIAHFLIGVSVGGVLVSSTILIFETIPKRQHWQIFSYAIIGGAAGAVLSFILGTIGWRSLYQIQILPIFLVPVLWHWSDEPLLWKIAVRDKLIDNNNSMKSSLNMQDNAKADNVYNADNTNNLLRKKTQSMKIIFYQYYVTIINNLANTYFVSLSEILSNRRRLLLPALILTTFGITGLIIAAMSFGNGNRQCTYQKYDLDVRIASRITNNDTVTDDVDAALIAYIIDKPQVLDLINEDDCKIDLMPQILRRYGYSQDDISGCVAEGLLELVKRLRGERITKELVAERAVLKWNSKFGNGQSEIDIPNSIRNRIKMKAGFFITVGERTLDEILTQQKQNNKNKKNDLINERTKTNVDKWQEWQNEFLSIWEDLLFVTEFRYSEGELQVSRMILFFGAGCFVCGVLGIIYGGWGRSWTQRKIFCVIFIVSALLSMIAVMLRRVELPLEAASIYIFICGLVCVSFVTCYLVSIPAMFSVTYRGAATGFCFGLPLVIVFLLVSIISVPYIYYFIPLCFVLGVFAIGIPTRKKTL